MKTETLIKQLKDGKNNRDLLAEVAERLEELDVKLNSGFRALAKEGSFPGVWVGTVNVNNQHPANAILILDDGVEL